MTSKHPLPPTTNNSSSGNIDHLGEALHSFHMKGTFYSRSEFTAPWGLRLPPFENHLMFHVILEGVAFLKIEGTADRILRKGDFALITHGYGHVLLSSEEALAVDLFDVPNIMISDKYEVLKQDGGGALTSMMCGIVQFDHPTASHLIQLLPKSIHIESWQSPQFEWIQSTLRLMTVEAQSLKPGGETIITRLADILIIQAIRAWLEQDSATQSGWLGALQDPQIGRAISAIHQNPGDPWRVDSLAQQAMMSRSAFAARFKHLVGESPMQYVTRWRMKIALDRLQKEEISIEALSEQLDYSSEASFSRAFKKYNGISIREARKLG
ncbi:MAG: AraC family transcriptional regulator [Chloroflexota bacterium]